jgi:cell division protein FtsL
MVYQPGCSAMAAEATFRKQVRELQTKLDQALREKDDLMRDLENMCLSDSTTTFNTSSVLQERIYSTGKAGEGSKLNGR